MIEPDVFDYDGVQARMTVPEDEIRRAMEGMEDQVDQAESTGYSKDGHEYCGCTTCFNRVVSAYWISWSIRMIRQGLIQV